MFPAREIDEIIDDTGPLLPSRSSAATFREYRGNCACQVDVDHLTAIAPDSFSGSERRFGLDQADHRAGYRRLLIRPF